MAWKRSSVRSRPGPPSPILDSRLDLNRGSVGHCLPDLVYFIIRHSDAAIRPVLQPMSGADDAETVGESMDKKVPSRGHTILAGKGAILLARIRNVDRLIELAVSIAEIQNVDAFGRLVITLPGIGTNGIAAERDLVGFFDFALAEEFERPLLLQHDDLIGAENRMRHRLRRHRDSQ
jgi:hypothetical protein